MAGWSPSGQLAGWSISKSAFERLTIEEERTDLVHVVVDMLSGNDGSNRVGLLDTTVDTSALELHAFLLKTSLDSCCISMMLLALLDRGHHMLVLFWKNLTVLYGLNRRMIMVLVDLTIDGGSSLLVTLLTDGLLHDGWSNLLVHGGVMVTSLVPGVDRVISRGKGKNNMAQVRVERSLEV